MNIDYKKQIKSCEQLVKKNQIYLPLLLECYLEIGKTTKAEKLISKYSDKETDNLAFLLLAAKTFIQTQHLEKADIFIKKALKIDKYNVKAYQIKSELALEDGDRKKYLESNADIKKYDPFYSKLNKLNDILEEQFPFNSEIIQSENNITKPEVNNINDNSFTDNKDLRMPIDLENENKQEKGIYFQTKTEEKLLPKEDYYVRSKKIPEGGFNFDHLTDKNNNNKQSSKEFDDSFVEAVCFDKSQQEEKDQIDDFSDIINEDNDSSTQKFNDSFVEDSHYKEKLNKISAFIESQEIDNDLASQLRKEIEDEELVEKEEKELQKKPKLSNEISKSEHIIEKTSKIKEKISSDIGINENNILRAFEDIDLVEEERVFSSLGNNNTNNEELQDDDFIKGGILIDDKPNFKTEVVDKVLGNQETPRKKNLKIATSTLGNIYSTQGEFQKAKETYLNLLKQYPDNLDYRKKYLQAEYDAGISRISEELNYYKELSIKFPENENYLKRLKQFQKENDDLTKEYQLKINKITEEKI